MKMAMTALAVVFLAQAAPALARGQDTPERAGPADHDRPHRDGERMPSRPPPPAARPAPVAQPAAQAPPAPAATEPRGGGRWSPGAGGYPGHGGSWTPDRGAPPVAQPPPASPQPQARTPERRDGDRFNGGRGDSDRRSPDWRNDQHDRDRWDRDRDHDRDRDRDRDRYRDHDRQDWGRYQGDTRSWGRYDWDRRWAGHEDRPRWEHGRYPPIYVSPRRYRGYYWRPPAGYYVRAWAFGDFLPRGWYGPDWFLDAPWDFDLPIPPPGFDWVRVGYDALLVDDYTGRVVQVVRNVFW